MSQIETLSKALGISESQLKGIRRQYRMEHGREAERELEKWLKHTWEESRDKVRRLGKGGGYSEFWSGSMGASDRHLRGNLHQEDEGVREDIQEEYSRNGWHTFGVLKGEELARREVRARAERLRQAELELRQKGKSPDEYVRAVDDAIAAMRAEAKTA